MLPSALPDALCTPLRFDPFHLCQTAFVLLNARVRWGEGGEGGGWMMFRLCEVACGAGAQLKLLALVQQAAYNAMLAHWSWAMPCLFKQTAWCMHSCNDISS